MPIRNNLPFQKDIQKLNEIINNIAIPGTMPQEPHQYFFTQPVSISKYHSIEKIGEPLTTEETNKDLDIKGNGYFMVQNHNEDKPKSKFTHVDWIEDLYAEKDEIFNNKIYELNEMNQLLAFATKLTPNLRPEFFPFFANDPKMSLEEKQSIKDYYYNAFSKLHPDMTLQEFFVKKLNEDMVLNGIGSLNEDGEGV